MTQPFVPNSPADDADDVYVFPASFAQQRLWFLDRFEPNSPFYNIPAAVRMTGRLDAAVLEQSLNEIVDRHETLRTTFALLDDQPMQMIAPALRLPLPLIDLQHLPAAQRESEALRLAQIEARTPFDLEHGPLLRMTLLRLQADEHIALVTMHHIISDGWSVGVFVHELGVLYHALSNGRPVPLAPLAIQYADYAHWQRERLQGAVMEAQLSYWKQQLGGELPVLALPTDRPRPAVQSSRGASLSMLLPRPLVDDLIALSNREGATLFMTLLAAFNVLLQRYSGQDDLCVGTPIANRTRAETEALIGCFINTLVLRADLSGNPSFRALLQRTRTTALQAYAHQDVPFETLVEVLQPDRDMSHTPLFQVMFILQNATVKTQQLPGLTLSALDVDSGTATFDLTFSLSEQSDGLDVSVEYSIDLFNRDTIARMIGHFQTLLAAVVARPDCSIAELPLLTDAERTHLLVEWNRTDAPFALDRCVHDVIAAHAARTPDAIAVVWDEQRLSYGGLNRRANQLAHHLHTLGVGPETLVGICTERSLEMIVAVLGVLKAGGAYVPLDPAYPAERLRFMLDDAQVAVLLTNAPGAQERIAAGAAAVLDLTRDWPVIAQQPTTDPANTVTPDNLAYVIYTSGSTGQPKGTQVTHRNLLNAYYAWEDAYDLGNVPSHLQMANFAFDVFSGDLVRALCSGARLVLCPRDYLLEPAQLYALMQREQIACAEFVPAVLRLLIGHVAQTGQRLDFMRLLICGSDSWYAEEYATFSRYVDPRTRVINSYGLTEATIDSTYFERGALELVSGQLVPIGRPFANTHLYILDAQRQPVPVGVPGELYIGGAGVARGYLNRPDLTAERFIDLRLPDSTGSDSGDERVYRTGDLARYRADGHIELLGRIDQQIKLRGQRIELGEIEAVLAQHPAVRANVVMVRTDAPGGARLVAYVVEELRTKNQEPGEGNGDGNKGTNEQRNNAPGDQTDGSQFLVLGSTDGSQFLVLGSTDGSQFLVLGSADLRQFVQARLPEYMTPSLFVFLDALPLTPNGKLDRRALPEPDWSQAEATEDVAPRTPIETRLAEIWAAVLNLPPIGIHSNFFELGGHSLLATQLISRVREAFALDLPLRTIFESPTVATFAEQIEAAQRVPTDAPMITIGPAQRSEAMPLSFAQQRLWFLDQLEPDSPFYNIPEALRLRGALDIAALERSLNEVVRRHESLRTCFTTIDGRPQQQIIAELALVLPLIDLAQLQPSSSPAEREAEALRLATIEAQQPFDLRHGPLLRAKLLRLDHNDHVVLLTMHHIIGDDWSTNVLISEVSALYAAFAAGQESPLAPLPIQYADYAYWQRRWMEGAVLEAQLDYWQQQLRGAPPVLELPTDRPRPAVQTFSGDYQRFVLPPELTAALNTLSQREGATLFMTLLAAFQTLLHRYSAQDDIVVGTPVANRTRAETEALIGCFINTLVLRADLSDNPRFRTLLSRSRETALGAYAHQDVPFEMLVDKLQPQRDLSHTPLFQVMFALQNAPLRMQALPGTALTIEHVVDAHSGTAKFDLTLFMVEEGDHLSGAFEYNTDLFDAATIARLIGHFETLLHGIVADPDQPVAALPLLTEAERQHLLVDWNDTAAPYPAERCVHELFAEQAARTPAATAIVAGTVRLSSAELDARSNQLAHHLRGLGVGPETLVGVCMTRSLDLMIALLGVLKAGGAYVPLDPAYPAERLRFMLDDAGITILLTEHALDDQLAAAVDRPDAPIEHVLHLPLDGEQIGAAPITDLERWATPDNLAYVIYTSGSTGRPKGTLITHHGLSNYLAWCLHAYPVAAGQGAPIHSSIAFDLTITGLFAPLLSGTAVHLLPDTEAIEPLSDALRTTGDFSLVKITPAHMDVLRQQLAPESVAGRTRSFIIGGENLLAESLQFWQDHAPDTLLINEYGPTETVVGCCVYIAPPGLARSGSVPIGRPIINTQLYVLDREMQPVPIGVPGELYIGGVQVARGYLNRPALTAERFVADPFSHPEGARPGARLYRTGDLVRHRADGQLEYLGRIDQQVKVRGFRIELGEIEAVLQQHPAVREAVVVARADAGGYKRLVAYIVEEPRTGGGEPRTENQELRGGSEGTREQGNNGAEAAHSSESQEQENDAVGSQFLVLGSTDSSQFLVLGSAELRQFVQARLPDYMVPSAFVVLDALPLTTNGKVDRRALPEPDVRPELERAYVAPRTPIETALATIWSEVLGLKQIGIHDNFFELGGDSILSIQIIARAKQAGLQLTPKQLFQEPTIAALAALVEPERSAVEAELPFWISLFDEPRAHLPADPAAESTTSDTPLTITVALTADETQALLNDVSAAYRAETLETLLFALAQSCAAWAAGALVVDVQTATASYPARLDLSGTSDAGQALLLIKEQLRAVPDGGSGYSLLRAHADPAVRAQIAALPQPEISLRYVEPDQQESSASTTKQQHRIAITGTIQDAQLRCHWRYNARHDADATVAERAEALLAALRTLIAQSQSSATSAVTPADMDEFGWSQDDLSDIMSALSDLE